MPSGHATRLDAAPALRPLLSPCACARRNLSTSANSRKQSIYTSKEVVQVNLPAESGDMGVLANHVPSIEQLRPGLVEIIEENGGTKQFFRTCKSDIGTNKQSTVH